MGICVLGVAGPHLESLHQCVLPRVPTHVEDTAAQPEPLIVPSILASRDFRHVPDVSARTPDAQPYSGFLSPTPCFSHLFWLPEIRLRFDGNEAPQLCARGKEVSE